MLRNSLYCPVCLGFKGYGREAGPGGIELEWMKEPCDWCQERDRQKREEVERLEAVWAARECADPDCVVVFTPRRGGQRFCSDLHRKRTHRRAKAAAERAER